MPAPMDAAVIKLSSKVQVAISIAACIRQAEYGSRVLANNEFAEIKGAILQVDHAASGWIGREGSPCRLSRSRPSDRTGT
ncbi:hypothetical protein JQ629_01805 [Bradyrhizobium sp. AUGA SZCCT0222]|uniref:hypothetical protein n=1 Tax=Bradyrhizobium sp. AUGA SZCCT0222 TaxID=2807668 RepID=UPI001BAD26B5|nr:hypothetical protein [Bradyrhizobium sp. AUGA SZCCT0222]MBR1266235.1 hypothetical protein [Bradyrhizobium sp. AUGA SZCCT0222]